MHLQTQSLKFSRPFEMHELTQVRDHAVHYLTHRLGDAASAEGEIAAVDEIRFTFHSEDGLDDRMSEAVQRTIGDVVEALGQVGVVELLPMRTLVPAPAPAPGMR